IPREQRVGLGGECSRGYRSPRKSAPRRSAHPRELCKLTVGGRTLEWSEPPIVHAKPHLMATLRDRQIVDHVELALLTRPLDALNVLSRPRDEQQEEPIRGRVPCGKQYRIG